MDEQNEKNEKEKEQKVEPIIKTDDSTNKRSNNLNKKVEDLSGQIKQLVKVIDDMKRTNVVYHSPERLSAIRDLSFDKKQTKTLEKRMNPISDHQEKNHIRTQTKRRKKPFQYQEGDECPRQSLRSRSDIPMRDRQNRQRFRNRPEQDSTSGCYKLCYFVGMVFIAALLLVAITRTFGWSIELGSLNIWTSSTAAIPHVRLLPLTSHAPADKCVPRTPKQIKYFTATEEWNDIDHSLSYYMEHVNVNAISAFHIGRPYCYVRLRLHDNSTVGMFNVNITGYTPNNRVHYEQTSTVCQGERRFIERSVRIWVSYIDEYTRETVIRSYNGTESYALQQIVLYNEGYSICDGSDHGLSTLHEYITHGGLHASHIRT